MLSKQEKKILIGFLPDGWRDQGAAHFQKSASFIEKVAYGQTYNLEIFEWLVTLAEETKAAISNKQSELKERIKKLG